MTMPRTPIRLTATLALSNIESSDDGSSPLVSMNRKCSSTHLNASSFS